MYPALPQTVADWLKGPYDYLLGALCKSESGKRTAFPIMNEVGKLFMKDFSQIIAELYKPTPVPIYCHNDI